MAKRKVTVTVEMKEIEVIIGKIMRIGVIFAALLMICGLLLFYTTGKSGYPDNVFPTALTQVFYGLLQLKAYAYMMAGIFALILTPVLRVVVSIYAFWKERDFLYVYITTAVFVILIISYLIGHR
ncbi:DUF1634 domain-containing protein [Liquorilactobacillus oeni]|uniref:Integral membrane protein n=1 Tax=Liquorilactobacillus oeni DSM 19972 TaxID=1423777 RepID=A0A0R1MK77_9LACO|nr:DUF1634 domain-containing protein [Liquorilactobacillus oeni]KRL05610.1 hypothetical protein FD46_GL000354 [Liquorilactobacillus oeni DSM 19972]